MSETSTIDRITERHARTRRAAPSRTRLHPTPGFLWYGGVLVVMALAGHVFGSNPAMILTFLLAGMVVAGTMQAWRRLAGLRFAQGSVAAVPAGRPASLPVTLSNPHLRPAYGVMVAPAARTIPEADRHVWMAALVPARGDATGELLLPSLARGIHPLPELMVSIRWPLGLIEAERRWHPTGEVIVYPAPKGTSLEEAHPQAKPQGSPSDGLGNEGDDFDGLRPYRPGDPPRHVHWKAAARGIASDPPVKVFAGSAAGELVLAWEDCSGGTEARLSQLARWVEDAFTAGRRFGLSLPGAGLAPGQGEPHRLACLRLLARWQGPEGRP